MITLLIEPPNLEKLEGTLEENHYIIHSYLNEILTSQLCSKING